MGIANSLLPTIADLGMETTMLALVLTLWLNKKWGIAIFLIWIWHFIVREGFGVGTPFPFGDATDQDQATKIYHAVWGLLTVAYAITGALIAWIFSFPELLPYYTLCLPRKQKREKKTASARHIFAATVIALIVLFGGYLTYALLIESEPLIAVLSVIFIPLIGYVIGYLVFRYGIFDKNVWVPDTYDDKTTKEAKKAGISVLNKTIGWATFFTVGGNTVLGLVRHFQPDVDWVWITAASMVAVILLLVIIFWFVSRSGLMKKLKKKTKKKKSTTADDEDLEDFVEDFVEEGEDLLDTEGGDGGEVDQTDLGNSLNALSQELGWQG